MKGVGGNFHLWANEKFEKTLIDHESPQHTESVLTGRWEPLPFITGHFGSVTDIKWSEKGDFLVSVSRDQTCRIFAPSNNNEDTQSKISHVDGKSKVIRWYV